MAVRVTRTGAVAVVTVERREALNALDVRTLEELSGVVADLSDDTSVRSVVLTGAGEKSFVAGADIAEMRGLTAAAARRFSALGQALMDAIETAPQPWIAAVNGYALGGGCELALACDVRLASEGAIFAQPEIDLGITPGFGATQRLPHQVGQGWARYLVLSGRRLPADEALRIGLVQGVFPREELMSQALRLAGELAGKSPLALRRCKEALRAAREGGAGQVVERDVFALSFASDDRAEGMAAFQEKRRPEFRGE